MRLPWQRGLAPAQKVWFVVYDEGDERRLRLRLGEFQIVTRDAGHGWRHVDLTDIFPEWMASNSYRESYFKSPKLLTGPALGAFKSFVVDRVRETLSAPDTTDETVVALTGVASLFGLLRVSGLVEAVHGEIRGRLVVFFPGAYRNNTYRLLDRRDGWDYLAVPLTE